MYRQQIKENNFFDAYFNSFLEQNERRLNLLKSGQVKSERILWFKKSSLDILLNFIIANYTAGKTKKEIELIKVIDHLNDSWNSEVTKLNYNDNFYNQYPLSNFDQMLWMLSLGYLLDIPNEDFKKVVEVIDRDGVKDYLFEFIIRAKLDDREPITEESYKKFFGVPKVFEKLRQAITETDKSKAEKLVEEFITKDWYRNHKDAGWYNSHKSKHDTYFGYWSFETAAVVKIMGLDDSSFIDCQYYPKDLVHSENC